MSFKIKKCKKIFFLISFIIILSCNKKEPDTVFYNDQGFWTIIQKNKNYITIFCDPLHINRYSSSFYLGCKFEENKFVKGYFLKLSESRNKLFDTIYSTKKNNVFLKIKDSLLIVKFKSTQIGGEQIFPNNYESGKFDTIVMKKTVENVIGIGFSKNIIRIKNEKSRENDCFNEPFFILNSSKKDSLHVMYKTETQTHFEINKGFVYKKNVTILQSYDGN